MNSNFEFIGNVKEDIFVGDLVESKKSKRVQYEYYSDMMEFIENIHDKTDRYFTIATNSYGSWTQEHLTLDKFIKNQEKYFNQINSDIYISINSFYNKSREISSLRKLNALWIDLDYYKIPSLKSLSASEVVEKIKDDGLFDGIEPSFIVNSGQGIYIYWLIESVPMQMKGLWTSLMRTMSDKFYKYGADFNSRDVSRVLRLPASINQKTKNPCYIMDEFKSYNKFSISFLADKILPYSREEVKIFKEFRISEANTLIKKEFKDSNIKSRSKNIVDDLVSLVKLRNGKVDGFREVICFLFRNFAKDIYSFDEIETMLHLINDSFENALSTNELLKTTNSQKKYRFKTSTIIKMLDITELEMKGMKELTSKRKGVDKVKKNEWIKNHRKNKRRDSNQLTSRESSKKEKIEAVKKLKAEGKKQIEIAEILGISKSTVSKYLKL